MTNSSNRCCDLFLCFRAVSPVLAVGGGRHCSGCFVEKWLYSARFLVLQVAARGDVLLQMLCTCWYRRSLCPPRIMVPIQRRCPLIECHRRIQKITFPHRTVRTNWYQSALQQPNPLQRPSLTSEEFNVVCPPAMKTPTPHRYFCKVFHTTTADPMLKHPPTSLRML